MVATSHMWLLSTQNVTTAIEKCNFLFCLILINLNLNNHMPMVATILDSTALEAWLEQMSEW